jgi:hypothetical protein
MRQAMKQTGQTQPATQADRAAATAEKELLQERVAALDTQLEEAKARAAERAEVARNLQASNAELQSTPTADCCWLRPVVRPRRCRLLHATVTPHGWCVCVCVCAGLLSTMHTEHQNALDEAQAARVGMLDQRHENRVKAMVVNDWLKDLDLDSPVPPPAPTTAPKPAAPTTAPKPATPARTPLGVINKNVQVAAPRAQAGGAVKAVNVNTLKSALSSGLPELDKENDRHAINVHGVKTPIAAPPAQQSQSSNEQPPVHSDSQAPAAVEDVPPAKALTRTQIGVLTHVASGLLGALLWHLVNLPRQRRGRAAETMIKQQQSTKDRLIGSNKRVQKGPAAKRSDGLLSCFPRSTS